MSGTPQRGSTDSAFPVNVTGAQLPSVPLFRTDPPEQASVTLSIEEQRRASRAVGLQWRC
jgi:hypothetical protein